MILKLSERLAKGSHADVFAPPDGRVYKLFRKGRTERATRESRAAFLSEAQAYDLALQSRDLVNHIPEYFGRLVVTAVLDASGRNRSTRYLSDCCYAMQRLPGEGRKAFFVPDSRLGEVKHLLSTFERAGIHYAEDSSVFGWEDGQVLKFIDIAIRDVRADFYEPSEDWPGRSV